MVGGAVFDQVGEVEVWENAPEVLEAEEGRRGEAAEEENEDDLFFALFVFVKENRKPHGDGDCGGECGEEDNHR